MSDSTAEPMQQDGLDDGRAVTAEGPMDGAELQSVVRSLITSAIAYVDGELAEHRALATKYYLGGPLGNEEDGRSQTVLTEVRDAIQAQKPGFLRVIHGADRAVEFTPKNKATAALAAQQTDFVNYLYLEECGGLMQTDAVFTDGMVRKLGVFKWWFDDSKTTKTYAFDGLSEQQVQLLAMTPGNTLHRVEQGETVADAQGQQVPTFNVELTRKDGQGRIRVEAVPPEEFLFSREARSLDDAILVAHRCYKTRGELIAMGISDSDIKAHASNANTRDVQSVDVYERRKAQSESTGLDLSPASGEANQRILYCEAFPYVDYDGDGIAELRRVCTIGDEYYVVSNKPADERPFSTFCPSPEPHVLIGQSWADRTMDMQKSKTMVFRATADSLALSIYPRTAYEEGYANVQDILNTEIGAPIRITKPGAVQPFTHPFTGAQALPVLDYMDGVIESRTGHNKGSMGLDADALQSSTKNAVDAAVDASRGQSELVARIFAETALKPMFRGLYRLAVQHQAGPRSFKAKGQWIDIDPSAWDADVDVTVNVALGTSAVEKKLAILAGIKEEQKFILSSLGPSNPVVGLGQYAHTLARMVELGGLKDTDSYFNPLPLDFQLPPAPPAPSSPEHELAMAQLQVEQMRSERELAIKTAELQLKQAHQAHEEALAVKKQAADEIIRIYAIDAQFHSSYTQGQLKQDTAAQAAYLEGLKTVHDITHAQRQQDHAEQQSAHDQQMAEREQALAEQQATQDAQSQSASDSAPTTE